MTRFNPFPKVSCKYGAPMGRPDGTLMAYLSTLSIDHGLCTSHPQGEYDSGGAYWGYGNGEGPVYAVWHRGHGHAGVVYVRAHSAAQAKRKALDL